MESRGDKQTPFLLRVWITRKKKRGAKQEDQQVAEQDREHRDDRRAHGGGRTRRGDARARREEFRPPTRFIPTPSGCAPSPSPVIDRCERLIPLCSAPSSLRRTPHQSCLTYRSCRTPPPLFTLTREKTLPDCPLLTTGPPCSNVGEEVHVNNTSGFQCAPPPQSNHAFCTPLPGLLPRLSRLKARLFFLFRIPCCTAADTAVARVKSL